MTKKTSKNKIAMALLILMMCIINAIVLVWVESNEPEPAFEAEIDFVVTNDGDYYKIDIIDVQDPTRSLYLRRINVYIKNSSVEHIYNLKYINYFEDLNVSDPVWLSTRNKAMANITYYDNDKDGRISKRDEILINSDLVKPGWEISFWYLYGNIEVLKYIFV